MRRSTPGMGEAFHSSEAACTTTRFVKSALRFMALVSRAHLDSNRYALCILSGCPLSEDRNQPDQGPGFFQDMRQLTMDRSWTHGRADPSLAGRRAGPTRPDSYNALTISSVIFLASPNNIMVLSR